MTDIKNLPTGAKLVESQLKRAQREYAEIDGSDGDYDPRNDSVELTDGHTHVSVALTRGLFEQSYVERVRDGSGVETLTHVKVPGPLGFWKHAEACQVTRDKGNAYAGVELQFQPNGGGECYSQRSLNAASAQREFTLLQARLFGSPEGGYDGGGVSPNPSPRGYGGGCG